MGKLNRHRLPAFSLPETIVAMVIILTVFGIAVTVIAGTGRARLSLRELKARGLLQAYTDKTRAAGEFTDRSDSAEGFFLHREVQPYPGYDSLLLIHFSVYDRNNSLLADWRSLERAHE